MEKTERTTKGLTFTMDESRDEDRFPICVYDAEGVRVRQDDRIEMVVGRTRMFGTVNVVTADQVFVVWDAPESSTVDAVEFENHCRVLVDEAPDGFERDGSFA